MRQRILHLLYRLFPFDLRGDCTDFAPREEGLRLSCVINFYGRLDLLSGILHSLAQQDLPRELFEVVLVEDRAGTPEGRAFCTSFADRLQVVYAPLDANFGRMGYSRNFGLSKARGDIVLFLDDDTVLLQPDFLSGLLATFEAAPQAAAVIPHGSASFALVRERYDFHDPYFMTSRCTAYRREVLEALGGFMSGFIGQEDVEFVVRFVMAGKSAAKAPQLTYYHPPLLVPNLRKPAAVGASFANLRGRYPLPIWMLLLANCARHAPLCLSPLRRHREAGRFGLGFARGVVGQLRGSSDFAYK